jgi:hypothetical protein
MITRSRELSLKLVYQLTHKNDDLSVEVPSFEQSFDRGEPLHLFIIARHLRVCTRTHISPSRNSLLNSAARSMARYCSSVSSETGFDATENLPAV